MTNLVDLLEAITRGHNHISIMLKSFEFVDPCRYDIVEKPDWKEKRLKDEKEKIEVVNAQLQTRVSNNCDRLVEIDKELKELEKAPKKK